MRQKRCAVHPDVIPTKRQRVEESPTDSERNFPVRRHTPKCHSDQASARGGIPYYKNEAFPDCFPGHITKRLCVILSKAAGRVERSPTDSERNYPVRRHTPKCHSERSRGIPCFKKVVPDCFPGHITKRLCVILSKAAGRVERSHTDSERNRPVRRHTKHVISTKHTESMRAGSDPSGDPVGHSPKAKAR